MRIAVLGAGITGLSAAIWLAREGQTVTLIDRVEPGDAAQASYGNAGILAVASVAPVPVPGFLAELPRLLFSPESPLFLRWGYLPRALPWLLRHLSHGRRAEAERIAHALAALIGDAPEAHAALAAGTGAARHLETARYVTLYRDRAAAEADATALAVKAAAGVEPRHLDRAALLEADPRLGPAYGHGLAWDGAGRVSDPGRYMTALFAHFREIGGQFLRAEARACRPTETGVAIETEAETLSADRAVIAMGAWSGPLVRALGHDPALESERGYHLALEGASHAPPHPYLLSDWAVGVQGIGGTLRFAGLDEIGGLDAGPRPGPTAYQRARVRRLYPDLAWEGERVWMGHRPTTPDSLPVLGPSPKAPAISLAYGGQHLGLTQGARAGRLVADQILGRTPNIDMRPYRAGRFD